MGAQERLLRAVEYGEVTRIGSSRPLRVNVRIVAATNEHLPAKVDRNEFRADLLDRLCFEVVTLPPLRARKSDVIVLAEHFGRRMAVEMEWNDWPGFGPTAIDALIEYSWPGNVRELRNVVERAVYRWERGGPIEMIEFDPFDSPYRPGAIAAPAQAATPPAPPASAPSAPEPAGTDFRERVERFERELLIKALSANRYNQRATATALNLSYDQLRHALKKHDLLGKSAD